MTEPGDARKYDLNQTVIKVGGREYSVTTLLIVIGCLLAAAVCVGIALTVWVGGWLFAALFVLFGISRLT